MARSAGAKGKRQTVGDPGGRRISFARRPDVLLASGRGNPLRGSASGADQSIPGAAKVAETRYQLDVATGTAGARSRPGQVRLYRRRHIEQPGRQENRKYLQHWQSEAATVQKTSLRQDQTCSEKLPQLHDGPADHAIGHPHPLRQALSHPRVLQGQGPGTPYHSRGGGRLDSRTAVAGRLRKSPCWAIRRTTPKWSMAPAGIAATRGSFRATPSVSWMARKGSGPRSVRS